MFYISVESMISTIFRYNYICSLVTSNNLLHLSEYGNFQQIFTWRCNFWGHWGTPKTFSKLLKLCVVQCLPIWKLFSRWELEFSKVVIFWDTLLLAFCIIFVNNWPKYRQQPLSIQPGTRFIKDENFQTYTNQSKHG